MEFFMLQIANFESHVQVLRVVFFSYNYIVQPKELRDRD
jgi:hypothetical protein